MKKATNATLACSLICLWGVTLSEAAQACDPPNTYIMDRHRLQQTKLRIQAGDALVQPGSDYLLGIANWGLNQGPWSVMDKDDVAPSGNKHDFLMLSPYYWPNDNETDGLPWVYVDGYINPVGQFDSGAMMNMARRSVQLGLAYYFTGNEEYAHYAAVLIRTWFIDPDTRQTPNFRWGHIVPGDPESGGMANVSPAEWLALVIDAVGLIECSPAWSMADAAVMKLWMTDYLEWLVTDPTAEHQAHLDSNHGSYYDVHRVIALIMSGDEEGVIEYLETVGPGRIAVQIEPDGKMPREIVRVNSLLYHLVGITPLFYLAAIGEHYDVDIWNYETDDGRSLRAVVDFLAPYAVGDEPWPYFPGAPFAVPKNKFHILYRQAAVGMWSAELAAVADDITDEFPYLHYEVMYAFPADSPYDLDDDWHVGVLDLLAVLGDWGVVDSPSDFNHDGGVDVLDFLLLLGYWGPIDHAE